MMLKTENRIGICLVTAVFFFLLFGKTAVVFSEGDIEIYEIRKNKKKKKLKHSVQMATGIRKRNEEALDLVAQRRYDEAIAVYLKIINRIKQKSVQDPAFEAEVYNNLAQCLYEQGGYAALGLSGRQIFVQAAEYAEKSVQVKEDYWPAYITLGDVFFRLKDYEKVDQYYSLAEQYMEKGSKEYKRIVGRHNVVRRIIEKNKQDAAEKELPSPTLSAPAQ